MNYEQLRIFITVVERRSFTKAAEALYISHSTTSRNVSALEETMGVRLLARDNRSVRLTPAGEILFREGSKLLKKIDAIEGAVRNAGLGLAGKLSVAGTNLYPFDLWEGFCSFCGRYPEIVLGMHYRDLPDIWKQVSAGEMDLGLTFSYALPEECSACELRTIGKTRFCAVIPQKHSLSARRRVKLSELDCDELMTLSGIELGLTLGMPMPTLDSLLLRLRSEKGLAVLPHPIALERAPDCSIAEIDSMESGFDVLLFWRKDNLNPSLPLFVDVVQDSFSNFL